MVDWIEKTIGKVRIDKYIARGGMAEVYLGTHLTLDRQVAVKMMHSFIESDPDLLNRFQREAKAVAGLRHPNIVQIYDYDTHESHPYIVMEYLKGPSLANYLRDLHNNGARLTLAQVAQLLKSLAAGIDYAHAQGITHRDIKPANIILNNKSGEYSMHELATDTECIITDFGLVRIANSATQTASGVVSGTPAYMSPEQAQGNPADGRSDTYSLGIVLYEMLAGRVPFESDSTLGVILKHISEPPPFIEGISPQVQGVINKALEKFPQDRYQTAHELLEDYYNAVGMHAEAETIHTLRFKTPPTTATLSNKPTPRRNNLLWIGAGLFICICLGIFTTSALGISAFAILPGLNKQAAAETTPTDVHSHGGGTQTADQQTNPPQPSFGEFVGILRFQGSLDQVTVTASLPEPADGTQYEAWLMNDDAETIVSIGVLEKNNSGQYTLTYLEPQSRNLLDGFNRMEITLETNPDASPNPSDEILYSTALPDDALTHIRHLLVSFSGAPNQVGLTSGLLDTSKLIKNTGDEIEKSFENGDEKSTRAHLETLINIIVGTQSSDHKDWDKNGSTGDPSDGFGLLLNGSQTGYIEGTITHAELSASAGDATANIKLHSEHVAISARNVEGWATQLRDVAKRILETPTGQINEADIRLAISLAEQIHSGVDLDGNESIDPVEGEGGSLTAYEHAEYMADMQILEGANQIPAPGE